MKDYLSLMATFPRHGHLVSSLFARVINLFEKKVLTPFQEQQLLSIWGKKYSGEEKLIDTLQIDDISDFTQNTIIELDCIQPDFFLFHSNTFITSLSEFRIAGIPDLVVEVWSKYNTKEEKDMKFRVYSSSSLCEHWYLTQTSNKVECWFGNSPLPNQSLRNVLISQTGLQFDLRFLQIK